MKQITILILVGLVLLASPVMSQDTNPDIELLRKKFTTELLTQPVDENQIKELVATQQEDGTWADINYINVSNTGFQHIRHLSNLVQMSRAYKKSGSSLRGKKDLKKAIYQALDYWLVHDFICDNWWNNEIGTPNDLTNVLLMMDKDLTKAQIEKTSVITGRAHVNAWGARPSGDRIKIVGIQAKNALFSRNVDLFEELIKIIEGEIKFNTYGRGMQHDYSFHHRVDRVNTTLSYGSGYIDSYAEWVAYVAGTRYQFSDKSLQHVIDFYLDGICKMMVFGKFADPGAANRDISKPRSTIISKTITMEKLASVTDYRKEELLEILQARKNDTRPPLSHSTFFWHTEYYTHQRPTYFTSVRMFSSRNKNMEIAHNSEGLMNHHRGDGTNYLSKTGNEYFHLSPVYDWQKIPGTTIMQKEALPSEREIQKAGIMDFVGAATNGQYGAVGFDFSSPHDPLKARKAWFFFDDEYVCLGTGIQCNSKNPVVTTLEQSQLTGEVVVSASGKEQIMKKGEHQLGTPMWIYHNGIGYIFPDSVQVVLSNRPQTGSWYKINKQSYSSREEISLDVFKLWIDHGVQPVDAAYQYIVMPSASKEVVATASGNPKVEIVSNTPDLQAVRHHTLDMLQAVFYKTGKLRLSNGVQLNMDGPGIIMIRYEGRRIKEITVADPLRKNGRMHFHINCKIQLQSASLNAIWNESKGVSDVSIELPQGPYAGKSISITL